MARKKRAYETYDWLSREALYCYGYFALALLAVAHNLSDTDPAMQSRNGEVAMWSIIGLGAFCSGIHIVEGKLRNKLLGHVLVAFGLILLVFVWFLSIYNPAS